MFGIQNRSYRRRKVNIAMFWTKYIRSINHGIKLERNSSADRLDVFDNPCFFPVNVFNSRLSPLVEYFTGKKRGSSNTSRRSALSLRSSLILLAYVFHHPFKIDTDLLIRQVVCMQHIQNIYLSLTYQNQCMYSLDCVSEGIYKYLAWLVVLLLLWLPTLEPEARKYWSC